MNSLFSLDSPVYKFLSRAADLIILNFLYFISCLPIITIGAATTAMYTLCFQFGTEQEQGVWKSYWQGFRCNFKQATGLWLVLLPLIVAAVGDAVLFYHSDGWMYYASFLFAISAVVIVLVAAMAFPLLSRFENTWYGTLKNAFLLSLSQFARAAVVALLQLLPVGLYLAFPVGFAALSSLWLMIYFAGAAYLSTLLLKKVYQPMIDQIVHSHT